MILDENSNSDIYSLVLARPADSMCAILTSAFRRWYYSFSICSSVFEVVNSIRNMSVEQPLVLIVRPAMLDPQAAVFMGQNFPNLRIIGWVDSGENVSDSAFSRTIGVGIPLAGRLDQLQQIIQTFNKALPCGQFMQGTAKTASPENNERPEYQLSNDEVNALLGVE